MHWAILVRPHLLQKQRAIFSHKLKQAIMDCHDILLEHRRQEDLQGTRCRRPEAYGSCVVWASLWQYRQTCHCSAPPRKPAWARACGTTDPRLPATAQPWYALLATAPSPAVSSCTRNAASPGTREAAYHRRRVRSNALTTTTTGWAVPPAATATYLWTLNSTHYHRRTCGLLVHRSSGLLRSTKTEYTRSGAWIQRSMGPNRGTDKEMGRCFIARNYGCNWIDNVLPSSVLPLLSAIPYGTLYPSRVFCTYYLQQQNTYSQYTRHKPLVQKQRDVFNSLYQH